MVEKRGVIETDVDKLISLLADVKEITVPKAAKKLNVSAKIVEEWANFLEEEGLLEIKYKLTTPILIYKTEEVSKPIKKVPEILKKPKVELTHEVKDREGHEKTVEIKAKKYPEDYQHLLSLAESAVKRGDVNEAKLLYKKLEEKSDLFTSKFVDQKKKYEQDLIRLNKEITEEQETFSLADMEGKTKKVNLLIEKIDVLIKQSKIAEAIDAYNKLNETHFPQGFIDRETELQDRIIRAYKRLLDAKNITEQHEITEKAKKIVDMLNQLQTALNQKNIPRSTEIYDKTKELYDSLAQGFLEEKFNLQNLILDKYKQLIALKKHSNTLIFRQVKENIEGLLLKIESAIEQNNLKQATKMYNQIQQLMLKIPAGFSKRMVELQKKVLEVYKLLIFSKKKVSDTTMNKGEEKINLLIEKANKAIANKKYTLVPRYYVQLIHMYSSLPVGFLQNKAMIKNKVFDIYKRMISNIDFVLVRNLAPEHQTTYNKMLGLLVQSQKVIDDEQYNLLENLYNEIYDKYESLPVGFVEKNVRLRSEIIKLFNLIKLYKKSKQLPIFYKSKQYEELKQALMFVSGLHDTLIKKSPEATKLLEMVYSDYVTYLNYYNERFGQQELAMEEVPKPKVTVKERSELKHELYAEKDQIKGMLIKAKLDKVKKLIQMNDSRKAKTEIKEIFKLDPDNEEAKSLDVKV